jgi:hypothetical protein
MKYIVFSMSESNSIHSIKGNIHAEVMSKYDELLASTVQAVAVA